MPRCRRVKFPSLASILHRRPRRAAGGSLCGRCSDDNETAGVSPGRVGRRSKCCDAAPCDRSIAQPCATCHFRNPARTASTRTRPARIVAPMRSRGIATTGCCRSRSKRMRTASTMPTPACRYPSLPRNGTTVAARSRSSCARTQPFTTARRSPPRTSNGRSIVRWLPAAIPDFSSVPARSSVRSRTSSWTIIRFESTTIASIRSCYRTLHFPIRTFSIPS